MAEKYGTVPPKYTAKWWQYIWDYYKWHIIITVIATGFEKNEDTIPSIGDYTSKSWTPKTSSISTDNSSSSGDLDIPTFLRKNKTK